MERRLRNLLVLILPLALIGCYGALQSETSKTTALCAAPSALSGYHGGTGTVSDPYLICNGTELDHLSHTSADWAAAFKLAQNIDLTAISAQLPIGLYEFSGATVVNSTPFTGTFDGNSHTISGLMIDQSANYNLSAGLFAYTRGAAIRNLTISSAAIVAIQNSAILVGVAENTDLGGITITSSSVHYPSSSTASGLTTGGLVGMYTLDDGSSRLLNNFSVTLSDASAFDDFGAFIARMSVSANSQLEISHNTVNSVVSPLLIPAGNTFGSFIALTSFVNATVNVHHNIVNSTITLSSNGSFSGGLIATLGCGPCSVNVDDNAVNMQFTAPVSFLAGYVGGLSGIIASSTGASINIRRNFVSGSITIPAVTNNRGAIAGLIGYSALDTGHSLVVQNNAVQVDLTILSSGSSYVGGIFGSLSVSGSGTADMENNYAVGAHNVTAAGSYHGGLIGILSGSVTTNAATSYFSSDDYAAGVGNGSPVWAVGLTRAQLEVAANFIGWDFTNIWDIGSGFPFLR